MINGRRRGNLAKNIMITSHGGKCTLEVRLLRLHYKRQVLNRYRCEVGVEYKLDRHTQRNWVTRNKSPTRHPSRMKGGVTCNIIVRERINVDARCSGDRNDIRSVEYS